MFHFRRPFQPESLAPASEVPPIEEMRHHPGSPATPDDLEAKLGQVLNTQANLFKIENPTWETLGQAIVDHVRNERAED